MSDLLPALYSPLGWSVPDLLIIVGSTIAGLALIVGVHYLVWRHRWRKQLMRRMQSL